ncbi:hypothetical protein C8J57DRAFT_1434770 [Mycena rebaudengoi]|nr:hypothetical protein C8J57DRAFT_1434770 [Mycena rebaudengoi]
MIPWRALLRLLPVGRKEDYQLLTDSTHRRRRSHGHWHRCFVAFSLRRLCFLIVVILVLLVVGVLLSGVPPSYAEVRKFEEMLPQHNLTAYALQNRGSAPMYLRFPGHLWGHGLNNVLQEAILMAYMADLSGRVYVFEDYVWSHSPLPYTIYDFALRPSRIPLNAFVSGPIAGGPLPPDVDAISKRAASAAFYEQVCPRSAVHTVSAFGAPTNVDGLVLLEWWTARLKDIHARCVEVDSSKQIVFHRDFFGSKLVLSLLPGLTAAPVLGAFEWSPLVHSAVSRNFALLRPPNPAALYPPCRHCPNLAQWGAEYMGFNQHPALPDRFTPPSSSSSSRTSTFPTNQTTVEEYYLPHCLPTPAQLAARLHAVRAEHPLPLSRVYILTNGWGWFVDSVRSALLADGWAEVRGSGDLLLDGAQAGVGMAVDMRVGEGAEVFLGNGFSSLTSNIVMLRMARGLEPATNRFL